MRPTKSYCDGIGALPFRVLLFFVFMRGRKNVEEKVLGAHTFNKGVSLLKDTYSEVVCLRNMLEIPLSTPPWHVYIRFSTTTSSSLFKMCKGLKHMRQMTVGACPPQDGRSGSQILACSNLASRIRACKDA